MRLRVLAVVIALASATLVPSIGSAAPEWSSFSTAPVVNFTDPALYRTADGVLHVLWVQEDSGGDEDLFQTTISPAGTVAGASAILTDWASMWPGGGDLVPTSDGKLRYFFGALRESIGSDANDNVSMLTSDSAGTAWTVYPKNVVDGGDASGYASTIGAGVALDGTPFQAFGGISHRGTDLNEESVRVHDSLESNCCAYNPDVATDQMSGRMYFGWYSNGDDKRGVWVHELDPATGGLVGDPMLMPGVTEEPSPGSEPDASDAGTRMPMTGRPGHDGVYVAYTGGYPFTQRMLVWRVGAATPMAVASTTKLESFNDPALTADPSGRLWVGWSKGQVLYFRRSNTEADRWGRVVSLRPPAGTTAIYDLKLNAQNANVDIVAVFDSDSGSPTLWHDQLLPGMSMSAPGSMGREATIRFGLGDAGVPLEGVLVRADGRSATTDSEGVARIHLGPYRSSRTIRATATKDGYTTAKVKIRVRV